MRSMPVMSELLPLNTATATGAAPAGQAAASQNFANLLAQALFGFFGTTNPQLTDLTAVFPELAGTVPQTGVPALGGEALIGTLTAGTPTLDPAVAHLLAHLSQIPTANPQTKEATLALTESDAWKLQRSPYGTALPGSDLLQQVLRMLHGTAADPLENVAAIAEIPQPYPMFATEPSELGEIDATKTVADALLAGMRNPDVLAAIEESRRSSQTRNSRPFGAEHSASAIATVPNETIAADSATPVIAAPAEIVTAFAPAVSSFEGRSLVPSVGAEPQRLVRVSTPVPPERQAALEPVPAAVSRTALAPVDALPVAAEPSTPTRNADPVVAWLPEETRIEPVAVRLDGLEDVAGLALRGDSSAASSRLVVSTAAEGPSAGNVSASVLAQLDRYEFVERISQALERAHAQSPKSLEIQLHPPSLGRLRIHVGAEQGELVARIESPSQAVRAVLVEQLPSLGKSLAEHGIQIQRFHVDDFPMGSSLSNGPSGGQSNQQNADQSAHGGRWDWRGHNPPRPQAHDDLEPMTIDQLWALAPGMNRLV